MNLLPFIDRQRLVDAMASVERDLTDYEKDRNSLGPIFLFLQDTSEQPSKSMGAVEQTLSKSDPRKENFELLSNYNRNDNVSGIVKGYRLSPTLG